MAYYKSAYSTRATIDNTKYYTQQILDKNIRGALVECGVAGGAQIGAMHSVCGTSRWIYGFDSFQGIPLASRDDDEQPGIGSKPNIPYNDPRELLRTSGVTSHPKAQVRSNLNAWTGNKSDNVVLVEGWFQDTLRPYSEVLQRIGGIALLRLDGDLYESTIVSLVELFPLLNDQGILIVDDWNLSGCRKACNLYFETHPVTQIHPPYGSESDGPAYFVKNNVSSSSSSIEVPTTSETTCEETEHQSDTECCSHDEAQ